MFAVIATTVSLVAVFVPRRFSAASPGVSGEFAIALAGSVAISDGSPYADAGHGVAALKSRAERNPPRQFDRFVDGLSSRYAPPGWSLTVRGWWC